MNEHRELPLVVIVGPTASGKTSLAIEIAEKCGGEIICADSRTVYKGLDIGTAKPTKQDRLRVPHWGLDLVEPGDYFSAADFKTYANNKIKEIRSRGNIPFIVGGTGLYVDSVIFDYKFGNRANNDKREKLNELTLEQLHEYCKNNNIDLPENEKNKRYVIRSIERNGLDISKRDLLIENTIIIGLSIDKLLLRLRIEKRAEQLFDDGVVNEAKELGKKYGWNSEALKGNIYPLVHSYLLGDITEAEMKAKNLILDWRLAKRQMTWLRRNKFIKWLLIDEAKIYLLNQLAKRS